MPRRHPRRAVTLIEAVLFISIALGLIVGGLVFFQQASTAQRTADTVRLFQGILTELRALHRSTDSSFSTAEAAAWLKAADAIPASAAYSGSDPNCAATLPWGECLQVFSGTLAGGEYIQLAMPATIPKAICNRIFISDEKGNGPLGDGIEYFHSSPGGDGVYLYPPISPADTNAMCESQDVPAIVTVQARFRFR